jgi:hypothetical protein
VSAPVVVRRLVLPDRGEVDGGQAGTGPTDSD